MAQKNLLFIILLSVTSCKCNDNYKLKDVKPVTCYPQEEVCNSKDEDCDGEIDEDTSVACSTACGSGIRICSEGKLSSCPVPEPALIDVCNGEDDNCNGKIDEDAEVKACYPRDNNELLHGECRFGIERCVFGKYSCIGWVEPEAEKCNGKDDNCNGKIDEGTSIGLDIVLILDKSGSMEQYIKPLINTTVQLVKKYDSRTDLKFALVTLSGTSGIFDGLVILKQNFSDVNAFIAILKVQNIEDGGFEATIDAIYDISTPLNPLGLNWSPGSNRVIIVYSDEEPQSWRSPKLTEQQAIDEAKNNNVSVYAFTDSYGLRLWNAWNSQSFLPDTALEKALNEIISKNSCK